jgi:hypothetical protein
MALQFPNRTAQFGLFQTGTPDYVDVDNTFSPESGMVTFAAKATDDSWSDGDTVGVLIAKNTSN